jgi:hypothetical protein
MCASLSAQKGEGKTAKRSGWGSPRAFWKLAD